MRRTCRSPTARKVVEARVPWAATRDHRKASPVLADAWETYTGPTCCFANRQGEGGRLQPAESNRVAPYVVLRHTKGAGWWMGQREKLIAKMRASPHKIRFDEVLALA